MILKQNADKYVILLHEIYGINVHIRYYAHSFFRKGYDVYVPNLLQKEQPYPYEKEEEAYLNFKENIGFEKASLQVKELIYKLSKQYDGCLLVGFSVGATVAWLCSEEPSVDKVIGFYGSRIRRFTSIEPKANVVLLYGTKEPSFDPRELKTSLDQKKKVHIEIVEAEHGFADPYSSRYQEGVVKELILRFFS